MYILFAVTIICFLMAFTSKLTKTVSNLSGHKIQHSKPNFNPQLLSVLLRDGPETRALKAESDLIRRELSRISMRDDYTRYVKVERKLVNVDTRLAEAKSKDSSRRMVYEFGLRWGLYGVLALGLVIISIFYRYTPVVVFGDNFNFDPFGRILSFPTGVPNAVSTVFWIVVNNFVARTVAGYVK